MVTEWDRPAEITNEKTFLARGICTIQKAGSTCQAPIIYTHSIIEGNNTRYFLITRVTILMNIRSRGLVDSPRGRYRIVNHTPLEDTSK